jgi:hypothetical protein
LVLDASLTRVGYTQYVPGDSQYDINKSFTLWDLQTEQDVSTLDKISVVFTDRPAWSQDGSRLAIIVRNKPEDNWERFELFTIDWDGEVHTWVNVHGNADIGLGKMRWSPNGRFIAIGGDPFIVLDTVTRQVWDYCISAGFFASPIYWSPDSKQLLVSMASRETGSQPDVSIVIDLEQDLAAQLHPDPLMIPIGWLENP